MRSFAKISHTSLVRVGDDSVAKYPGLTISGGTFTQDNFIVIKVDRGTFYLKEDGAQAETTTTQARVYSIKLTTEFEYNDVQIKIGEHTQLRAEVKPDNAVNKNVKWESNRPDIATVDSNGRVTAVAKGKAIISAVTEDKGLQASCMVTVKE